MVFGTSPMSVEPPRIILRDALFQIYVDASPDEIDTEPQPLPRTVRRRFRR
jgi:hypothetical protein